MKKKVAYKAPKRAFGRRRKGFVRFAQKLSKDAVKLRKTNTVKEDLNAIHHFIADPDVHATAAATVGGYASLAMMDRVQKHKEKRAAHRAGRKMIAGMTGKPQKSEVKTLAHKVKHAIKKVKSAVKSKVKEDIDPTEIYMTESEFQDLLDYMVENYDEAEVLEVLAEWAGLNEDVEPINEISKKTLGRYVSKASDDIVARSRKWIVGGSAVEKHKAYAKLNKKNDSRMSYMDKAVKKMKLKEEVEPINEDRVESTKVVKAFLNKTSAKGKRSHTDGTGLYLHGHKIAWHAENGAIHATMAGWGTTTTRDRLNTLTRHVHGKAMFNQKGGVQHFDGKPIGSHDHVTIRHGLKEDLKNPKTKLGKKAKVLIRKGKRFYNTTDG